MTDPSRAEPNGTDPSIAYLLGRLGAVETAVRAAVARRRGADTNPEDPFRGLYIAEEQIDALLATTAYRRIEPVRPAPAEEAGSAEDAGATVRLRALARAFGLDDADITVLVIALAPDLDPRFERLYGYLNDDVTRRRATVGLALELAGQSTLDPVSRARLGPSAALVAGGLVVLEDEDRPMLGRGLRVPDRVCLHLLGDNEPDPALLALLTPAVASVERLSIPDGVRLAYLRDRVPGCAQAAAAAACPEALRLDLSRLAPDADTHALARTAGREVRLNDTTLVAGPIEALAARGSAAVRAFADLPARVVLTGSATWNPAWSDRTALVIGVEEPAGADRVSLWQRQLDVPLAGGLDLAVITAPYRLAPGEVARAADTAALLARLDGGAVTPEHLRDAARSRNAAGLEGLARRTTPGVGWADLVLPEQTMALLRELAARVRHRDTVLGQWRMRPGGLRGTGVTGLFAGDSGTGKTMAAEVLAGSLGLDLYVVDLSTVVDKYIGETEKNLEKIFTAAAHSNSVLLFDEADALFGKRSEVSDAHDRYANVETAYLLQRMETFDGVALLTTNLRANIDEAFLRRLDVIVDFPKPDEAARLRLWRACLTGTPPVTGDVDLEFCARAFELSGGNIRSIAVTAGYLAAESGRPLTMADLITAVHREYRKLGRLTLPAEFGDWLPAPGQ